MGATTDYPLGRLEPGDFEHVGKYPLGDVLPATVDVAERLLQVPGWRASHDQGREGSCVGHAVALERAITNRAQLVALGKRETVRYDPLHVWNEAKRVDEWDFTNPGDNQGTSVRAAYQVVAAMGLSRVRQMRTVDGTPQPIGATPADALHGVAAYRWATTIDEMRTAIANGLPVAIGVAWFTGFDLASLERKGREYWLRDVSAGLGKVRGGHAVCLTGASDRRQAFRLVNSWGTSYPLVWLPYSTMSYLLQRGGEAAVVTDK